MKRTASAALARIPTLVEESHDVPLVELVLATRGGSAGDAIGNEGALSLAFRSLRRGAGARRAFEIDEAVDRLGSEFGASIDVSGGSIHATVIRRKLEPFLDLFADLVLRPTFPKRELEQVIRETRADIVDSRNDDRSLAARAFRRTLFAGHPYGRPAGGTLETLGALTAESAVAAYRGALVRGNLVLGAAGDITAPELARIVADRLGGIPDGPSRALPIAEPVGPKGRHLLIVDKPARSQTQIYIGALGMHPSDRDHTALLVANTIFGGTFTARLMREVRSKRGWSYGASSRLGRDRARDAWYMWTFPAATDAAACVSLQLAMLEELLDRGVTDRELTFAKSYLTRSYAFEIDTAQKRLGQRLDEILLPLPKGYYAAHIDRVNAVTREDANAALRKRLSANNLLISIVATATEMRGPLEKAIPRLASTRVQPFDLDLIHRERVLA